MPPALELSFELFPPPPGAEAAALACLEALAATRPRLISITCGANGAEQAKTAAFIESARARSAAALAPHMTCVGGTPEALLAQVRDYGVRGIRHLVLLRGDRPAAQEPASPGGFTRAAELVAAVSRTSPGHFELAVAGYPEGHPESEGVAADIDNLARKVEAGARRAITQFCFDTEAIVRYRDACVAAGLEVPVVPGILPVARFAQLERFAARCGASIPPGLGRRFLAAGLDAGAHRALAIEVATAQVERLRAAGFGAFHFYTLNEAALTLSVCEAAGLIPAGRAAAGLRIGELEEA